ncbi:MAG: hypothetical protein QG567_947 [Campylobacterota bacterium]|nr:hypothetical protein [Campylobacterota bacterium]
MKVKFYTDKSFDNKKTKPRDIRNIVMSSLSSVDVRAADIAGNKDKENHSQSFFVYPKPRSRSFEILHYGNDLNTLALIEAVLIGKVVNLSGTEVKIARCEWIKENYVLPAPALMLYKTRTPIVISVNPIEHKIVHSRAKNDSLDVFIEQKIKDVIKLQIKQFFNKEIQIDDLKIKIIEKNKVTVSADEEGKKYSQAVFVTFASNYKLPRFVGYWNGLGYGELLDGSLQHKKIIEIK